jgi:hypothetical protein
MPPENEKYIIGFILMSACMKFMGKMFRYGIPAHTGPFRELPVNIITKKRRFCFTMELYYTQEFNTQLLITVHNFSRILTLV